MQGRTFVFTFFTSFFLLITSISIFNDTINLAFMEHAAEDLVAGKIIADLIDLNFDDRFFQKLIIKKMEGIPSTIALGSSRSMLLRTSYLGLDQGNFFNHSVILATLNDYIAILGIYKKKGAFPKTIIIGVDPWIFYKKSETTKRWKSLFSDYYYLINCIKRDDISKLKLLYKLVQNYLSKAKGLLAYNYTIDNFKYFNNTLKKGIAYKVVKNTSVDAYLKMPDGSIYYPFKVRFRDNSITQKRLQDALEVIKRGGQISFQKTFISFIDYLLNNGTQIIFFLHPYHPLVYQEIEKKMELQFVIKIEEMLKSLAEPRNILVFGSYDPSRFGFLSRDFFDGAHAHDYAVKKIFKEYRQVAGD